MEAIRVLVALPLVFACSSTSSGTGSADAGSPSNQGGDSSSTAGAGGSHDGGGGQGAAPGTAPNTAGPGGAMPNNGGAAGAAGSASCALGKGFSDELDAYPQHPSAASTSVDDMLGATRAAKETLTAAQIAERKAILSMYRDFGIDPSLDATSYYSDQLAALAPKHWSMTPVAPLSGDYLAPFSIDAPVYNPIPCDTARTPLPDGYFDSALLTTVHDPIDSWDTLGYGVAVSGDSDLLVHFRDGTRDYMGHVPSGDLNAFVSAQADKQVSFIDSKSNQYVDCYQTHQDTPGGDVSCAFVLQQGLPSLGDQGGSIASGMSTLAGLVRKGELTNPTVPLRHALLFASNVAWKARVYPAHSGDNAFFGPDGGAHYGGGLVPYGAVVQLDPSLDLSTYRVPVGHDNPTQTALSLPARRVLEALQTYGAYMTNIAGSAFNIYTATDSDEYQSYGRIYDPYTHGGVQDEIGYVLAHEKTYVVLPVVKR